MICTSKLIIITANIVFNMELCQLVFSKCIKQQVMLGLKGPFFVIENVACSMFAPASFNVRKNPTGKRYIHKDFHIFLLCTYCICLVLSSDWRGTWYRTVLSKNDFRNKQHEGDFSIT